jgi:hypothetical protein
MTLSPARPCSKCGAPRRKPGQRYCRACHAAYMRDWRARERSTRLHVCQVLAERGLSDILNRHFPEAGRAQ